MGVRISLQSSKQIFLLNRGQNFAKPIAIHVVKRNNMRPNWKPFLRKSIRNVHFELTHVE